MQFIIFNNIKPFMKKFAIRIYYKVVPVEELYKPLRPLSRGYDLDDVFSSKIDFMLLEEFRKMMLASKDQ